MTDDNTIQSSNLLADIHVVSNRIGRAFAAEVTAKFGLSIAEWRVVLSLHLKPERTARDITRAWGMEKMAVNRAVRRLEDAGHVVSALDRADKRRHTLKLSRSGQALYRKIEPAATARYYEITADLTAREKDVLAKTLAKLVGRTDDLV
jgi:DNA-binding MarR family transcriptional regulator